MDPMAPGRHSAPKHDHLWVLVVIAAAALAEVWGSWVGIGSISGFPVLLGKIPTDWILALVMEGYWAYGLFAWLAASPGPRSRSFAMWSCGVVFILSLVGQVTYHEMTVPADTTIGRRVVVAFVTILPVTGLALIAILIHLRHTDRTEAQAAAEEETRIARADADAAAAADERTALRAQLALVSEEAGAAASALEADAAAAREATESARRDVAAALARAEAAERKLAAASAQKRRPKAPASAHAGSGETDPTNELRAVMELRDDETLRRPRMGGELARRLGIGASTGRRLHGALVKDGALTEYAQSLIGSPAGRSQ